MTAARHAQFVSPVLRAAYKATKPGDDVLGWKLADGAEVLRIGSRLLVAEPDGRVVVRDGIPNAVPVSMLTSELRGCSPIYTKVPPYLSIESVFGLCRHAMWLGTAWGCAV